MGRLKSTTRYFESRAAFDTLSFSSQISAAIFFTHYETSS
jgi:hypothetical protein